MAGVLKFNRGYAEFGANIRDFEKTNDVGMIVTEFLWYYQRPFYPIASIVDSKITSVWLGEDEPKGKESLDLIFRMAQFEEPDGFDLYEIVLRGDAKTAYGGWVAGKNLRVSDDIVNGHRVLETENDGYLERYTYSLMDQKYHLTEIFDTGGSALDKTTHIRRQKKLRR